MVDAGRLLPVHFLDNRTAIIYDQDVAGVEHQDTGGVSLGPDHGDDARWANGGRRLTRQTFLTSFQFSQGSVAIQRNLFEYLKMQHPDLSLPAETECENEQLARAWLRAASAIVENPARHVPVDTERKYGALMEMLNAAEDVLNYDLLKHDHRAQLVATLAQQIVERDAHFLRKPAGRDYTPGASASSAAHFNPYRDPWRSDVCYFGLLGKTTGQADFDALFAAIGGYWRACWNDRDTPASARDAFRDVVFTYNDRHAQYPELQVVIAGLSG